MWTQSGSQTAYTQIRLYVLKFHQHISLWGTTLTFMKIFYLELDVAMLHTMVKYTIMVLHDPIFRLTVCAE